MARLVTPAQLYPILKSSRLSTKAVTCCLLYPRLKTIEKTPDEPVKSRFQHPCPGHDGKAGCKTISISVRVASHWAKANALFSIAAKRTARVFIPRNAREQSSGETAQPMS